MCSHCAANYAMREYLMRVAIKYVIPHYTVRKLNIRLINESNGSYRLFTKNKLIRFSQAVLLHNGRYSANYSKLHKVKYKSI